MKITLRPPFLGIAPLVDARSLPEGVAQDATNCKLWKNTIKSFGALSSLIYDGTDAPLGLYRFGQNDPANGDTQFWWTIPYNAHVARGPVFDDSNETTFFTYENPTGTYHQRITDTTFGASGTFQTSRSMSVPRPTVAPTVTTQGSAVTTETKNTRYYRYTYVNASGKESAPSPDMALPIDIQQTTGTDHYARIVLTEPSSDVDYQCFVSGSAIRIYRSANGTGATQFQFVGELGYNGSVWSASTAGLANFSDLGGTLRVDDQLLSSALGIVLPSEDWDSPPATLHGLRAMPGGLLVGIDKNMVCFCDPYHTQAWPLGNRHALEYHPVAIGVFGNSAVVGTNGMPYILSGTDPVTMVPQKIERQQACVSARSMVELGGGVAYASPDGLCVVDGSGLNVVSSKFYGRDEWQALNPSSIHAVAWDGRYVMWYDAEGDGTYLTGLIWDFITGPVPISIGDIRAAYADLLSDKLYVANELGRVYRFDSGAALSKTYRSKLYESPSPSNYGAAQVHAASYASLTLNVYALLDSNAAAVAVAATLPSVITVVGSTAQIKISLAVTSRDAFHLPSGFLAREWCAEVVGTDEVLGIELAGSMKELKNG